MGDYEDIVKRVDAKRRTSMREDIKEILTQNRMILELNMKIAELVFHNPIVSMDPTFTGLDDAVKDKEPGSQL